MARLSLTNPHAHDLWELAQNPLVPPWARAAGPGSLHPPPGRARHHRSRGRFQLHRHQIRALYVGAMLKRARWVDYAGFEITFQLLKAIRDERLGQAHPANYTATHGTEDRSFLAMAESEAKIPCRWPQTS